jgi:tRNA(Ile)-lysidine synthase
MSPSARAPARQTQFVLRLQTRVGDFIQKRDILRRGEPIIVGVSGGPDSTALLRLLATLRSEFRLRITAAHFDHRLRSREEARSDRESVERLCRSLRVPLVTGAGDVKRRSKKEGESIEEAARNLRYRFLGREAKRAGATAVVVGHTQDDRAETVLLHLIRGSGLDGLAAMPPRSPWPFGDGPEVARPLLNITRREVERYCEDLGLEPRRDPTNDLPVATRNRLRSELMPVLRSFNPKAAEALARLADLVAGDSAYLDQLADAEWQRLAQVANGHLSFDRRALLALPAAIAVRVLRRGAGQIGAQPEAVHLERALAEAVKQRSRVSIPGGVVIIDPEHVSFAKDQVRPAKRRLGPKSLSIPGRTRAGGWSIEATKVERDAARPRDAFAALLDIDAIDGPLAVRSRRPGDRLRPLGLGGSKKLQDILVDAKVPQAKRDQVPVIEDRLGIVWVAGHCIDQRVAVSSKTRRVMRLRARRSSSR